MSADFVAAGFGNFLSRTLGDASSKKKIPHKSRSTHRCTTDELKVKLALGQHIVCYMRDEHGDAFVQRLINNENAFLSASTDETVEIQIVWCATTPLRGGGRLRKLATNPDATFYL